MVFADSAVFSKVKFLDTATFRDTDFHGRALFGESVFHRRTNFTDAKFGRWANFADVRFVDGVDVYGARARLDVPEEEMNRAWPEQWELLEPNPPDDGKILDHEGVWGTVLDTTMFGDGKQ